MKVLNKNEVKTIELNILQNVASFCKEKNISFYLSGGTLLGAIRHKGFIPWDDDIDICMPRPDYEKFIRTFKSKEKNLVIRSFCLGNYIAPYTKVIDLNTKIELKYDTNAEAASLWIDIFPIDGLPDDLNKVKEIYDRESFYRSILMLCNARLGEGTTLIRKFCKYFFKPLAKIYGRKKCVRKMEQIARKIPYENSNYVGAVTWGLYGTGERMLKKEFEKSVLVDFEGIRFPTFSCWDSYLKGLYGDYMELPPIKQRRTHDMKVYLVN